ncbi:hypothetical protein AVEN_212906-1 [Araneus ventricosus]|uniref:Uncharacterized protein n=1 Tax=Araneus ventricosus TaxID=182803 RepID=A0A4Y2R5X5_ARAVE|nr:hypothetical protein AVEN_212906-1 [Araneus ventricosus]
MPWQQECSNAVTLHCWCVGQPFSIGDLDLGTLLVFKAGILKQKPCLGRIVLRQDLRAETHALRNRSLVCRNITLLVCGSTVQWWSLDLGISNFKAGLPKQKPCLGNRNVVVPVTLYYCGVWVTAVPDW